MPDPTAGDAYEAAKAASQKRIDDLEGQRATLLNSQDTAGFTDKPRIAQQIRTVETALSSAYRDAAVTARAAAAAASKDAITPNGVNSVAALRADADSRRADAMETRAAAYAEGTAAKRQQLEADSRLKDADAAVAQAKADLTAATTPDEISKAHIAVQQAQASLDSTTAANKAAGYNTDILRAKAAVAPRVEAATASTAEAGATTAANQAAITGAQAGVAPQAAQAAVDQAQANVNKTNQELSDLQRAARQAPTDAQAQQAIQTQLQQKQVELQAAQTQLEAAQKLMPLSVAQAGANVEATQAGTQKGLLGNLYGLQDRIKTIADALRSGQISDPAQAQQQLQNYINTTIAGTTPFEAQRTALDTETQRRQQDYSLAGQQGSNYTSGISSALSTFAKMNDTAPVGSDVVGLGMIGFQRGLADSLRSFTPQNLPMNSPLLQSMAGMGGVGTGAAPMPAAPAAPAAPTTTITPDGTVTIQHTSSDPATMATGIMRPSQGGAGPMPAMLTAGDPAMPNHVSDAWANDPNLNPGNAVATRTAYGDLNRGM